MSVWTDAVFSFVLPPSSIIHVERLQENLKPQNKVVWQFSTMQIGQQKLKN